MRWALGVVLAVLAAAAAIGVALVLASSGEGRPSLVVAWHDQVGNCVPTRVLQVDPTTLEPKAGRTLKLRGYFERPVRSPDGKEVALAGASGTIAVVDIATMSRLASIRIGSPYADAEVVAWPAADRLVANAFEADAHRIGSHKLVVLDPIRGTRPS